MKCPSCGRENDRRKLTCTVWGCPRSLQASNLLISFVMSCLFGCPMGYVIGVRGGGLIQGGLISSGAFALLNLILTHPLIPVFGVVPWLIQAGLFGLIVGLIPGGIIGLHVQLSKS